MATYLKHAYGYVKASQRDCLTPIPEQIKRVEAYFHTTIKEVVHWGSILLDESPRSERGQAFFERVTGRKAVALLRPGDHLIVPHLEIIWRGYEDFRKLLTYFRNQGMGLHILGINGVDLDTSREPGESLLRLLVGVQETAQLVYTRRRAEVLRIKRRDKTWKPASVMYGCKKKTIDGRQRLVWNRKHRRIMAEVVRLRDEERRTWGSIGEVLQLKLESGPTKQAMFVRKLYRREKMIVRLKIKDPMDIPRDGINSLTKLEEEFGHEPPPAKEPPKPKKPSAWPPPDWNLEGRCKKRDRPKKGSTSTADRPESDL